MVVEVPTTLQFPPDIPPQVEQATNNSVLDRWEEKDTRLLISSYYENKHLFHNRGKKTKKEIFKAIAGTFNSTSDRQVTGDQCLRKWTKLEAKYKEVEDHNKITGNERKTWKFMKEMGNCLESSPKINPEYTLESCGSQSRTSTPSDDFSDTPDSSDESRGRKVKQPTRKRKSKSSAAEMLDFLQSYAERREKAETEKLELLKSMKEEKKEFYSQFLDVLRQK